MANPRKFSEKIALHTQKQAEETAAFEQIMREARAVTTAPQQRDQSPVTARQPQQQQLLHAITNASFPRGGSLPNVNAMAQRGDRTQPGRQIVGQLSTSPRASQSKISHQPYSRKARAEHAPYASPPSLSHLNQAVSGGNSPTLCPVGSYGSNNYLSIPVAENAWRRANSDSAINSINSLMIPSVVPDSSEESSNNSNDPRDGYGLTGAGSSTQIHPHHQHHQLNKPQDGSGVIPTTVGDGPNLLEIPTSVSTGSLPDLTNFQFQPPIQQPVEVEDPHNNTSPYSTSPLSMTYSHSPTSCSPHSQQQPTVTGNLPQQQQVVQQQQPQQVQHQQQHQPPRSPIPSHIPQQPQTQHHQHPSQQQQQQQPHQSPQQQHSPQPQTQPPHSSPSQHHPNSPSQLLDNSISVNTSFQQQTFPNENMLTAYRCPPRPSPQNSPSPFRSPSPHDGQLSAPPSPSNQPISADSLFHSQQAIALQQHFEQISMGDGTSQTNTSNNNRQWQQGGGMANNSVYFYNVGQQQIGATAGVTTQQSPSHHQPQTPQTPSSIPDIIFTDCTDPLEDFLTSEDAAAAFREGLGPIDTGDFQMLADPNLVLPDPQAEDTFRMDRL